MTEGAEKQNWSAGKRALLFLLLLLLFALAVFGIKSASEGASKTDRFASADAALAGFRQVVFRIDLPDYCLAYAVEDARENSSFHLIWKEDDGRWWDSTYERIGGSDAALARVYYKAEQSIEAGTSLSLDVYRHGDEFVFLLESVVLAAEKDAEIVPMKLDVRDSAQTKIAPTRATHKGEYSTVCPAAALWVIKSVPEDYTVTVNGTVYAVGKEMHR